MSIWHCIPQLIELLLATFGLLALVVSAGALYSNPDAVIEVNKSLNSIIANKPDRTFSWYVKTFRYWVVDVLIITLGGFYQHIGIANTLWTALMIWGILKTIRGHSQTSKNISVLYNLCKTIILGLLGQILLIAGGFYAPLFGN